MRFSVFLCLLVLSSVVSAENTTSFVLTDFGTCMKLVESVSGGVVNVSTSLADDPSFCNAITSSTTTTQPPDEVVDVTVTENGSVVMGSTSSTSTTTVSEGFDVKIYPESGGGGERLQGEEEVVFLTTSGWVAAAVVLGVLFMKSGARKRAGCFR